jgi:hypothetical protein
VLGLVEGVVDDLRQRQSHHREVDAARADRQPADQHTGQRRAGQAQQQRRQPVQAQVHHADAGEVAAHTQKGGVSEAEQPGVAEQQVVADREQTEDQDVDGQRLVGHQQRKDEQEQDHRGHAVAADQGDGSGHRVVIPR